MQMFATYELDRGCSIKTVVHRCCSVSSIHKEKDLASPCGASVNNIFKGARRDLTRRKSRGPKAAITPAELLEISIALGSTHQAIRDRAVLTLGYHGALRRSEISNLDLSDITFGSDGIIVVIGKSKTDQLGVGVELGIQPGQNPLTCPVETLLRWIEIRGTEPGPLFHALKSGRRAISPGVKRVRVKRNRRGEQWPRVPNREHRGREAHQPIAILYERMLDQYENPVLGTGRFTKASTGSVPAAADPLAETGDAAGRPIAGAYSGAPKRLEGFGINTLVKRAVALIGKNPKQYGAHSLRSSMITAAISAGEDVVTIMRRTRHKNLTVLQGYDRPELFSRNPMAKTGL
jgi:integrase